MIQLLKSPLKILVWFAVGLICVAIAIPLIQKASTTASNQVSIHAYTPTNKPGTPYWSVGVTRDANHLPDL